MRRLSRGAKTKKEERDSGFGARSQTTPIGPLLLDAPFGRVRSLPTVPGASEWGSLDRVRRDVRNRFSVGRLPAVRTTTTAAARGAGAPAPTGAGRGRPAPATCEPPPSSGAVAQRWRSTWAAPRGGSGPEHCAGSAERPADDVLDGRRGVVVELAPPAGERGNGALRRGRAQAKQRRRAAMAPRSGRSAGGDGGEERAAQRQGQAFDGRRRRQHPVAASRA